ncbi:MAG: ATP-binding protein [Candidatus Dormibacteria bacterium]
MTDRRTGFTAASSGYLASEMAQISELKLPAQRDYIVVAKRAAGAIGTVAGFDVDAVDDLTIAVSQAFENACSCLERSGFLTGHIRIAFKQEKDGIEVTVRSGVSREDEITARHQVRAQQVREDAVRRGAEEAAATELALRLMGLFVDQSSYRLDERTGGLRVRLTKYRAS